MSASSDFLVEIGTEELPPKALRQLESAFAQGIQAGIELAGLAFGSLQAFSTPRRLAVLIHGLQLEQQEREVEKRGPPVKVAFGADGIPTRAAEAFAQGCGIAVSQLERLQTPKGEWLVYRGREPGQSAALLLPGIVERSLAQLPIPKRMRWGNGDAEFVRPVHWVVMLLGNQVLDAEILGVRAGAQTRGHRFMAPGSIKLGAPADYLPALTAGGHVLPDFDARSAQVSRFVAAAAAELNGTAIVEPEVLAEVTALVEWPVPVSGRFDSEFLQLPEEVLISTLQDHQRYFPVRGPDGKLLAHFIAMSNIESRDPEQVRLGNERVVRPRLADATFFWQQDCRRSLTERRDDLRQVVFERDLGSLFDKSARTAQLAHDLAGDLLHEEQFDQSVFQQWAVRAAHLAKTDLLTSMVGEFPELQGRMGYYYALQDGEPRAVAQAIEEQYLPRHAGDRLPATPTGRVLGIADRLDTLCGIFAAGKRPTGNKDPYGLRRAALGLLRICVENSVDLDLRSYLVKAAALQPVGQDNPAALAEEVFEFVIDRLRAYYVDGQTQETMPGTISPEMFEAVRARSPSSPLDFQRRLDAVRKFMSLDAAESLAMANKRIANILRGANEDVGDEVDPGLFESDAERTLHAATQDLSRSHTERLAAHDYSAVLLALAALRQPVDAFFDGVMVLCEDGDKRRNRLALLSRLRHLFLDVADLSLIPKA